MSFTDDVRFDGVYLNVAQTTKGIEPLLDTVFSFLRRKTDFFSGPSGNTDHTDQATAKVLEVLEKHKQIFLKEKAKKDKKDEIQKKKKEKAAREKVEKVKKVKKEEDVIELGNDGFDISNSKPAVTPKVEPQEPKEEPNKNDSEEDDSPPPLGNGGTVLDKYVWTQTLSELNLLCPLPPNTRGKDLDVTIKKKSLKIKLKSSASYICNSAFTKSVIVDDSFWTLEDGSLAINLQKLNQMEWWDAPCVDDTKIDTKKVQPENSSLGDLDGDTRQTVEKMMFDQRQKAMGLPSADEQKKLDILEQFKRTHPEMDFSKAKFT